jgi:hypothetical protein
MVAARRHYCTDTIDAKGVLVSRVVHDDNDRRAKLLVEAPEGVGGSLVLPTEISVIDSQEMTRGIPSSAFAGMTRMCERHGPTGTRRAVRGSRNRADSPARARTFRLSPPAPPAIMRAFHLLHEGNP